ncbi:CarD family transcriptional regulator [Pullulanibacillus sp. KACC 23026]|uniref:CarD family transcriptional regulator n=1 Tax=Pullulanibacillus sp. KACC 23026 TaxID=3028315 RepID=UPI0023AFA6F9|nr:CarD family transcriptional regulator [Pullulanibacillus sp. KACC 23026]WEG14934.1 CarD family transcriptional regulator [Pullulanibacillus sp. KACC 23026]
MLGAGKIKAIEDKEISGEKQRYYIIKMSISKMDLMIPEKKLSSSGIRPITELKALNSIITIVQQEESDNSLVWKQRYKVNMEKMKTGNLKEEAEVVRDLMSMQKEKALNGSEKKLLDNARDFLISELNLIEGITENQIQSFCLN